MPSFEDFNWVKARSECSLGPLFQKLALGVKADVETINELGHQAALASGGKRTRNFEFVTTHRARFAVMRVEVGKQHAASVEFTLTGSAIAVEEIGEGTGSELFRAVPKLNSRGECVFTVGPETLELWQIRERALAGLFADVF
jgi:hypothetical protein